MKENENKRRFVELEWVCPNCDGVNRGSVKTCQSCGAPQPENVQFRRAASEQVVTDEKKLQMAQAGADIHCAFCGTRNPGNLDTCSQCGADLREGKKRESGKVLQSAPVAPKSQTCTACGAENTGNAKTCSQCGAPLVSVASPPQPAPVVQARTQSAAVTSAAKAKPTNWLLIGGILGALLLCCVIGVMLFAIPSKSVQGTVTSVEWQTFVPVQEIRAVDYNDKTGSVPSGAYNVSCRTESEQVCTTNMVDQGNGFAEEVTECRNESTEYCDYTVDEWKTIQTYTLSGADNFLEYDTPTLSSEQRLGEQSEEMTVYFSTSDGQELYKPDSVSEFEQFTPGSTWNLKLNALGGVLSVEK